MEFISDVLIIGAGPAGMSAAIEIAKAGEKVLVLEDAHLPGGPDFRHDDLNFKRNNSIDSYLEYGYKLTDEFKNHSSLIKVIYPATVLGIWKNNEVLFTANGSSHIISPKQIIIATGANEKPLAFPGWTLPGVITSNAVKTLIHTQHVRPGSRAIVSGIGPSIIEIAKILHHAGVEVIAALDANSKETYTHTIEESLHISNPGFNLQKEIEELKAINIPLLYNHSIFQAQGQIEVTGIIYGPLDTENSKPKFENGIFDDADLVVLCYGFIPDSSLTSLAGCKQYHKEGIGWCTWRNQYMETSVDGVFAIGDCAEPSGLFITELEGKMAALKVLHNLNNEKHDVNSDYAKQLLDAWTALNSARNQINAATKMHEGLLNLMKNDTLVCRCEEVNFETLKLAVEKGSKDLQAVKLYTRLGMGPCQGRNCSSIAAFYMCKNHGLNPVDVGRINQRPPTRSVTLGELAGLPNNTL